MVDRELSEAAQWSVSGQAAAVHRDAIVCDLTLPWTGYGRRDLRASALPRLRQAGFTFVSLTLCTDSEGPETILRRVAAQRRMVREDPTLRLVESTEDIIAAKASDKLAVAFNFQGTNAIGGDLALVEVFFRLGVKHMLMAYNRRNSVGDGCHERTDVGLSHYGVELVHEMNRVGMIVDVSHTGYRTSMETMEVSKAPVIFSHSNPKALHQHDRNITDEQAIACARTGGLVGINGVDIFLNDRNQVDPEILFRAADHYCASIGPEHVGLGLDFVYDPDAMSTSMAAFGLRSPGANYDKMRTYFAPEQLPELTELMLKHGYSVDAVHGLLGGNFLRVAREVWEARPPG